MNTARTCFVVCSKIIRSTAIVVNTSVRTMSSKVKQGDSIPSANLHEGSPTSTVNIADLCAGKKVIIFGVPGAFTPGCDKTHLPGYIAKYDDLKKQGINEIICVSVNDAFVMKAWGDAKGADGKVRMLADPNLNFTKAIGVETDISVLGGLRSKRYSMIVDNKIIQQINVEPDGTGLSCSLADHIKI